jgi:hypothetical protein
MTIVLILLALAFLRFVLVAAFATLLIRPVAACPACFRDTVSIRRPWLERLTRSYEWRWCPHCRWQGPARKVHGNQWIARARET